MFIIGYVLIILGIIFIMLGIVGAASEVFARKGFAIATRTIVQILKLLPDVINALAKAPKWLSMTIIGIILLLLGLQIV
jgi:hypothetical protein